MGVWHVKKLNSRGEAIETGFIPVEVRSACYYICDVIPIYNNFVLFLVHLRQVKERQHCHHG